MNLIGKQPIYIEHEYEINFYLPRQTIISLWQNETFHHWYLLTEKMGQNSAKSLQTYFDNPELLKVTVTELSTIR